MGRKRKPATPVDSLDRPIHPQFLNVDLVLESRRSLAPLVEAWERRAIVLYHERKDGVDHAGFEVSLLRESANGCIRAFVRLVEALPPDARALWAGARKRDLDIGMQMGRGRFMPILGLSADTVRRAASINARIVFTVYPSLKPTRRRPIHHHLLE
jgi:hypothetical protein